MMSWSWIFPGLGPLPARSPSAAFPVNQPAIAPNKIRARRFIGAFFADVQRTGMIRVWQASSSQADERGEENGAGLLEDSCRSSSAQRLANLFFHRAFALASHFRDFAHQ